MPRLARKIQKTMIKIKRAYEPPQKNDGLRILVDRLWPRGIKKEDASIDHWLKAVAPSTELRKWFGHDPEKWEGFQEKYKMELKENPEALDELKGLAKKHQLLTLVYAAKGEDHNNALVLKEILEK